MHPLILADSPARPGAYPCRASVPPDPPPTRNREPHGASRDAVHIATNPEIAIGSYRAEPIEVRARLTGERRRFSGRWRRARSPVCTSGILDVSSAEPLPVAGAAPPAATLGLRRHSVTIRQREPAFGHAAGKR